MAKWRLNEARKNLDAVLEQALTKGPQTITLSRGRSVVVRSTSRRTPRAKPKLKKLSELFAAVPLAEIIPARSRESIGRGVKFD